MSAPTPAQPSEGAMFMWGGDIPNGGEGWEWRIYRTDEQWACGYEPHKDTLYEARPKPEPKVAVMLPRGIAESYAKEADTLLGRAYICGLACREALAAE